MSKAERVLGARRLSRDTDASTSIERQGEVISLAVRMRENAELIALTEDVDVSGAVSPFERDSLGPWLTDAAMIAKWDTLIVPKLDRLTRSIRDLDAVIKWCLANGKTLVSVSESIDLSTPTGRMVAKMIGLFAEWELERMRERNGESHASSAAKGWYHGGHAVPWGYRPVKVNSHWELVPDEETRFCVVRGRKELTAAGQVRDTVDAVLKGASIKALADALGCDPKGLTDRLRSKTLTGHVVRKGDVVRGDDGMPVLRKEIIDVDTWGALQARLDGRKIARVNRFESPVLLHIAHCAHCGGVLYANQRVAGGVLYRYYRHISARKVTCAAKNAGTGADGLEAAFERALLARFGGSPVLEEIPHPAEDHTAELDKVNGAIADWEAKAIAGDAAESVMRILDGLYAKRGRLAALPQSEAWTEYVDTGRDLSDEWEEWGSAERNSYLRRVGIRVLAAKGTEPVYEWGALERPVNFPALLKIADGA